MADLVSLALRELPDTDKSRYDIAYERGRAQARSSLLLGGLAFGAIAGAAATFFLDPERGKDRRDALVRAVGARWRDAREVAVDRIDELQNRAPHAETSAAGTIRADEREWTAAGTLGEPEPVA
jgi:hypothetical protein